MSESTRVGRRGFLGTGLAVVAGLGLGGTLTSCGRGAALAWRADEADGAFPDREVHLEVHLPAAAGEATVALTLMVRTPREAIRLDLGEHTVAAGRASIPVRLVYPYEDYVPGAYAYEAEVVAGGAVAVTERPVVYNVRPMAWFS